MRKHGKYKEVTHEKDHQEIVDEINRNSLDPITVTVTLAATEYAVEHKLDVIPSCFFQVCTSATTGAGVLVPATTAWTSKYIYVKSASAGIYHIIVRK